MQNVHPQIKKYLAKLEPWDQKKGQTIQFTYQGQPYIYVGEVEKGSPNGKGTLYSTNKIIQSYFECGFPIKEIRTITPQGYFLGPIQNNKLNGNGCFKTQNFNFNGRFNKGKGQGKGDIIYSNGDIFAGQFLGGYKQNGVYSWKEGYAKQYNGQFENDQMHGQGQLTTQEYVYKGEFREGSLWGEGQMKYVNGQSFIGNFQKGCKHGQGQLRLLVQNQQIRIKGKWTQDILNGQASIRIGDQVNQCQYNNNQFQSWL